MGICLPALLPMIGTLTLVAMGHHGCASNGELHWTAACRYGLARVTVGHAGGGGGATPQAHVVLSLVTGLAPGIGVVGLARWGGWPQWWCAVVFAALDDGGYAGWANPATASAGLTWCVIAVTTFLVVDQNVRAPLQQEERKGEMEREAGSTEVLCCHCFHCYALRVAMEIWSMDRMVC